MGRRLIVLNTLVSYARSVLAAGLTLFSTRWVLEALGKADLGLYYAVGGVVVFLSFINTSLSFSSSRHFAYGMGQGGIDKVQGWFNSALSLHFMLTGCFLLLSVPLGLAAFRWLLVVPDTRTSACVCVYVCSVMTTALSMVTAPYGAVYVARQHIYELTIIQLGQTLALFALAGFLLRYNGDRLVAYAVGTLVVYVLVALAQVVRCRIAFMECRIKLTLMWDRSRYVQLVSFSGWSLMSTFAYILRGQGIALVLNNFGTSGANAAYGIANQVSGQASFLSNGFMGAISPEIITLEGRGDRAGMIVLATRTCKFATFLVLLMAIPLFSEVETLLSLWLKNVPENAGTFVRIMVAAFLSVQMVLGVSSAIKAVGRIAMPEFWAALALLVAVPLAYAGVRLGFPLVYAVGAVALTSLLTSVTTLYWAHMLFDYPVKTWIKEVLLRSCSLVLVGVAVNGAIHMRYEPSFIRLVLVGVADVMLLALLGWWLVLDAAERAYIFQKFMSRIKR